MSAGAFVIQNKNSGKSLGIRLHSTAINQAAWSQGYGRYSRHITSPNASRRFTLFYYCLDFTLHAAVRNSNDYFGRAEQLLFARLFCDITKYAIRNIKTVTTDITQKHANLTSITRTSIRIKNRNRRINSLLNIKLTLQVEAARLAEVYCKETIQRRLDFRTTLWRAVKHKLN